jgi:hypothetical protein
VIVDGVPYTAAQIRAMVAEVRRLELKVAELTDTLTLRSAALNRVATENDRLRETCQPL